MTNTITTTKTLLLKLPTFEHNFKNQNQNKLKDYIYNLQLEKLKNDTALAEQLTIIKNTFLFKKVELLNYEISHRYTKVSEKDTYTIYVKVPWKGSVELFQYNPNKAINLRGSNLNTVFQPVANNEAIIFTITKDSLNDYELIQKSINDELYLTKKVIEFNNEKAEDYNNNIINDIKAMLESHQKNLLKLHNTITN